MKSYLVGGAVRDRLLGLAATSQLERDWVVVGATPKQMLAQGFKQVGRDFPVFLHPRNGEQYALARTERKTGAGHAGFVCDATPDVTLEQDLARRDLTINAIAEDETGALIDPYGGRRDLGARVLRHVSPAFAEDPLRIFRVARFAAQLPEFVVHEETMALMRSMTAELPALAGERVWQELAKAASTPRLFRFFEVVQMLDGSYWFDEWDLAATIDLYRTASFNRCDTRLAAPGWVNDVGAVHAVYQRLRAPRLLIRAAKAVARDGAALAAADAPAALLLDRLQRINAFRQGDLPALLLDTVEACAGVSMAKLRRLIDELSALRVAAPSGPEYGRQLRQRRLERIENWQRSQLDKATPASVR